jgi:hypothetical protein
MNPSCKSSASISHWKMIGATMDLTAKAAAMLELSNNEVQRQGHQSEERAAVGALRRWGRGRQTHAQRLRETLTSSIYGSWWRRAPILGRDLDNPFEDRIMMHSVTEDLF